MYVPLAGQCTQGRRPQGRRGRSRPSGERRAPGPGRAASPRRRSLHSSTIFGNKNYMKSVSFIVLSGDGASHANEFLNIVIIKNYFPQLLGWVESRKKVNSVKSFGLQENETMYL